MCCIAMILDALSTQFSESCAMIEATQRRKQVKRIDQLKQTDHCTALHGIDVHTNKLVVADFLSSNGVVLKAA
jgi:hypothetical protein